MNIRKKWECEDASSGERTKVDDLDELIEGERGDHLAQHVDAVDDAKLELSALRHHASVAVRARAEAKISKVRLKVAGVRMTSQRAQEISRSGQFTTEAIIKSEKNRKSTMKI